MRADTEEFRDSFEGAGGLHHDAAALVVGEALGQVAEQESGTLHRDQGGDPEARGGQFAAQLCWPVQVGGEHSGGDRRQAPRPLDARYKPLHSGKHLVQALPEQPVHPRRPPGDRRGDQWTARAEHPVRRRQRSQPVGPLLQVIQRSQQQHRVGAVVGEIERPGVADRGVDERVPVRLPPQLLDVQRYQIAVDHLVSQRGQPEGVRAWPAAHVRHHGGWRWQVAQGDFLRPLEFELADRAYGEACPLRAALVMRAHVFNVGHESECPATVGNIQTLYG